jgi:hypothetical protein
LDRKKDILQRLGKLPEDLKQAYDDIYNAMSGDEKCIADRAFRWVMCACEPLTTEVLLPAISQEEKSDFLEPVDDLDEELVLKYCHNLLVIDPVRKVWVPSHLSVIEYLEHLWNQTEANCLVFNVCLSVLQETLLFSRDKTWSSKSSLTNGEELALEDPLRGQGFDKLSFYARCRWPIHAQKSAGASDNVRIPDRLEKFLGLPKNSSFAYRCWLKMVHEEVRATPGNIHVFDRHVNWYLYPDSIAGFAYCAFNLALLLPNWHGLDWVKENLKNSIGENFLDIAVNSESVPMCRRLIKHGLDANAQTTSAGSALANAAYSGAQDIVEFLVREGGADVNMQLQSGRFGRYVYCPYQFCTFTGT